MATRPRAVRRLLGASGRGAGGRRDPRGVDVAASRREGGRAGGRASRAARDAERSGIAIPSSASSRRRFSGSSRVGWTRRYRRTRTGIRSTRCRSSRTTTRRSSSGRATGSGGNSRTRISVSLSRRRASRSPSCATSMPPPSDIRWAPRISSVSCSGAGCSRRRESSGTTEAAVAGRRRSTVFAAPASR